jgi:hypothetical protein
MDAMSKGRLWLLSGFSGLLAVVCYILAITLPWPETQLGRSMGLLVVSAWPVLSIVYSYGLYNYIAAERDGAANRLAFVFGVVAFTVVLAMIIVQLTVGAGVGEFTQELDEVTARAVRRGLRLIDLGLDVAWDMLVGVALIFLGAAMLRRSGLGLGWAIPSAVLGIALIGLNAATFPWPPADAGLFDIGPLVGLFIMALAGRLALLGWRAGLTAG